MRFISFLRGSPFEIELGIEYVNALYIHEEVVESSLIKLVDTFKKETYIMHPVLIDKSSNVVLDGTHRVKAFSELGIPFIPVVRVNYYDPNIQLKRWFRVIEGNYERLGKILRSFGFKGRSLSDMSVDLDGLIVLLGEKAFSYDQGSKLELYEILKKVERKLKQEGFRISYVVEQKALSAWQEGKAIIVTPILKKEYIIRCAVRQRLFPPKTTRHVFPVRPVFIDFPIRFLRGEYTKMELETILREFLLSRPYAQVHGRITLDRYYEEDILIVFL